MAQGEPLVFCPGQHAGQEIAVRLADHFGWHLSMPDTNVKGSFATNLCEAYTANRTIVGICASGILIRALASVIGDKFIDPPVICVAPDGQNVISLLGGHHGANRLANEVAKFLNANLVLTTASDCLLGLSLEEPPAGWRLENPYHVKAITAAILATVPTTVRGDCTWLSPLMKLDHVKHISSSSTGGQVCIEAGDAPPLRYREQTLALGVGCVRNCSSEVLWNHVTSVFSHGELPLTAIEGVYSIELKSNEAAIHDVADRLGVSAHFFPPQQLESLRSRLASPSDVVFRETGCHGVSEGSALAAAGADGELIIPKQTARGVTCAVARFGSDRSSKGIPRGTLMIVGIGPGSSEYRTIEAQRMLGMAEDIVGYSGYLEGLEPALTAGRKLFKFDLGQEVERCRLALEQAGKGRRVALVSSGDAGIYAMASLVFEILDTRPEDSGVSAAAQRVKIQCSPGISAMQMASARVGALLGHDFCAISLSDLLTLREDIVRRIQAAAAGDFVVAFYNPVSHRRQTLLEKARDILLTHRSPETPVLIAKNLTRKGEELLLIKLSALRSSLADMRSIVIVGNSHTRSFIAGDRRDGASGALIYTPRGYSRKGDMS